jgi:hypothetical protein
MGTSKTSGCGICTPEELALLRDEIAVYVAKG